MFEGLGTIEGYGGIRTSENTGVGDGGSVLLRIPNDATYIPWM